MQAFIRAFENAFLPFSSDDTPRPPGELGAFLRWALVEFRWVIGGLGIATLAYGALDVWAAWYLGRLVDMAAASGPAAFWSENWLSLSVALFLFCFLRPIAYIIQSAYMSLALGPNLSTRALFRLHRHTLGQALGFFQDDFAGRLASKQMQTSGALVVAAQDAIMSLGLLGVYVIVMVGVFAATDWRLAVATLIWLIIFGWFISTRLEPIRSAAKARAESRAIVNGRFVDSFTNMATVKLFAHAGREEVFAREGLERYRRAALTFGREGLKVRIGITVLNTIGSFGVIALAVWLWMRGTASVGDLAAASAMIMRATQMSGWVAWSAIGVFENIGTVEDGAATLGKPHRLTDKPNAHKIDRAKGAILFENIGFQYGRDKGGVDGLSLSIKPGERIGLVGRSGAGKSTLVNLLLRLYDVEDGRVTLDGHDLRDLGQTSLRRQIAMVTQDTAMFNRSALDNILYGRPEAGREAAVEAARRARSLDFIHDLRDREGRTGFEAHIGERGVKLSGGQRQRIAIARAILKDAPVLVLDEATSALDSEVEAEIQDELAALMEGRTVIAIAHRLSTIAHLDRIVVMDAGRIVEDGPHDALLASGGLYAGFWKRQSGGFLGVEEEA